MNDHVARVLTAVEAGVRTPPPDDGVGAWMARQKLHVEAAVLLAIAARDPALRPLVTSCAAAVRDAADTESTYRWLTQVPDLCASAPGAVCLLLDRLLGDESRCGRLAGGLLRDGWGTATELTPAQVVEGAWVARLAGADRGEAEDSALRRSALAVPLPPLFALRQEAYGFTHVVVFAADLGARPLPGWVRADVVERTVAGLLLWHLARDDADLLAETLLASELLGCTGLPEVAEGWAVLAGRCADLGVRVPDSAADAAAYHPAVAAAMAFAALGGRPVAAAGAARRAAVQADVAVVAAARAGRWHEAESLARGLPPSERAGRRALLDDLARHAPVRRRADACASR